MGNVTEYKELMVDLENLRKKADGIVLMSAGINRCTDLSVIVRPFTFDVFINDDLIYSFNDIENAKRVYDIVRADISGRVYDGN